MLNVPINIKIANQLLLSESQIKNVLTLLQEGSSIPFISRYRKEMTGSLDEVSISSIRDLHAKITEIEDRRNLIILTIDKQGNLTSELNEKILNAETLNELEDIYLPFKPKRKTKASVAKEKGLEPLAKIIIKQIFNDIQNQARLFITKDVKTIDEALQGARDIIAEWLSENATARNICRNIFSKNAIIYSKILKGKENEGSKFRDYFDFSEPLKKCPSHRLLAIRRGENEGFLKIKIEPNENEVIDKLENYFVKNRNESSQQVAIAINDCYKRLIQPSIETEFKNESKEKADDEAIRVFAENLRQLLMASPLGAKTILAIDPGFRTGCKIVCLNNQGLLIESDTIYPHQPQVNVTAASQTIINVIKKHKIEAIAIGNGTAGRETEEFIKHIVLDKTIQIFMVNENGASIYSASEVAREEFGNFDITVRGTVSIGRRLMDPLSELVKIDPKSIGVGQYQHDVDQSKLQKKLDEIVISCVNQVGVDLNIASKHLLKYVSGLGPQLAENIIQHRMLNGNFKSRDELKNVPRLGPKAFEQCAGFLRIKNAKNPLDNSAVHPESYNIVKKMANDLKCNVTDLLAKNDLRKSIIIENYVNNSIGLPTLKDIVNELAKPGLDPRSEAKAFSFDNTIHSIDDLIIGMVIPGIVTNITNFGAFIDIGVKQDGLVHISQISNKFITNPSEVLSLNQHVNVKIIEVDVLRKRILLSIKEA